MHLEVMIRPWYHWCHNINAESNKNAACTARCMPPNCGLAPTNGSGATFPLSKDHLPPSFVVWLFGWGPVSRQTGTNRRARGKLSLLTRICTACALKTQKSQRTLTLNPRDNKKMFRGCSAWAVQHTNTQLARKPQKRALVDPSKQKPHPRVCLLSPAKKKEGWLFRPTLCSKTKKNKTDE